MCRGLRGRRENRGNGLVVGAKRWQDGILRRSWRRKNIEQQAFFLYVKDKTKSRTNIRPLRDGKQKMVSGDHDMANVLYDFFPVGNGATADRGTSGRQNDLAIHLDYCRKGDEENQRPTNLSSPRTRQDWASIAPGTNCKSCLDTGHNLLHVTGHRRCAIYWRAATIAPTIFKRAQNRTWQLLTCEPDFNWLRCV
jgi:hypothetical protein